MRKETFDNCELYCGDCMDIMPALPAASVDLVLTDPPYNLNWKAEIKLSGLLGKFYLKKHQYSENCLDCIFEKEAENGK